MLEGRNIIIGITGSIAAYKAAMLVRMLVREGANVKVLMTPLAKEFITPLTMATLSKNPVPVDFFDPEDGRWNSHVGLGIWADLFVIAPATANTMAKMAHGIGDNLLLTTYLSARCPVLVAPAMDVDMFNHAATLSNIETLRSRGVEVVWPADGELASGLTGKGRMEEPEVIFRRIEDHFGKRGSLAGRKFLVTAGPTVEAIDPVRFISNYSTGKMGYAIAAELAARGAEVNLVSGPTALPVPRGVERTDVVSADDMYCESVRLFEGADGAVMCAAVADYAPAEFSTAKLVKSDEPDGEISIRFRKTKDIAAALGKIKGGRVLAGFALETGDGRQSALDKLERKNLDFIVLNSLKDPGAGFGFDTNKITIFRHDGSAEDYPLAGKREVAAVIVNTLESYLFK